MTNEVAHKNLKVIIDKNAQGVAFGGAPAFLDAELDIFLNQAQNEIISNKFTGNNVLQQGFEANALRMSELDKLVCTDDNVYAVHTDYNEFVLDNVHNDGNRLIILQVMLHMQSHQTICSMFDHTNVRLYKQTYCNTPWIEIPVYTIEDNKLYVYIDPIMMEDVNFAPSAEGYEVKLTYVRPPIRFNYLQPKQELEFSDDIMEEIINRAAVIALESIESQRATTKTQINQLSE